MKPLGPSRGTDVLIYTFIVLEVAGYIEWPWLWVLTPLWVALVYLGILQLWRFILVRCLRARYA